MDHTYSYVDVTLSPDLQHLLLVRDFSKDLDGILFEKCWFSNMLTQMLKHHYELIHLTTLIVQSEQRWICIFRKLSERL